MKRSVVAALLLASIAGLTGIVMLMPTACQAGPPKIDGVSVGSAKSGARVTIKGSGFGASSGDPSLLSVNAGTPLGLRHVRRMRR